METRLLRYFVAVAEEGTVSRAAEVLHIAQPSLSRQVAQLERQLGLKLFERSGTRKVLTSEGREFLRAAREVLEKHAQAEQAAHVLATGGLRRLSLAAPRTTLVDVVAPFVATFTTEDPVPTVSEISVDPQMERVLPQHDLVVTTQTPDEEVVSRPIANLPVWAYVPQQHRWSAKKDVSVQMLAEETLILVSKEFKSRHLIDGALQIQGVAPKNVVETFHGNVAQALASAGRGVAVVTDDAHFDLHPLRIHMDGDPLQVHLHAAWRSSHHAHATLTSLADRLADFCRRRYGETLERQTPRQRSTHVSPEETPRTIGG